MREIRDSFSSGLRDGIPVCLGYIPVSFAFGLFAVGSGFSVLQAVAVSMLNVTSAGQFAAVPIIAGGSSLAELALSQLVINSRYSLMSVALSQKLAPSVRLADRLAVAFMNTDEVFAIASGRAGLAGRRYLYGLVSLPYAGWTLGTVLGAAAGNVLPEIVISALGIAIYGMFIAILAPAVKSSAAVLTVVLTASGLSCLFRFVPFLHGISSGIAVVVCSCAAAVCGALFFPEKEDGSADAGTGANAEAAAPENSAPEEYV